MTAKENRQKLGRKSGVVILISNLILFGFKYVVGILSNSVSIQADAINNLTDTISAILTIVGFQLSAKPKDKKHPNGYGRMEYLSGLAVAVVILLAGVLLIKTSIERLITPEPIIIENFFIILVPILAIFAKLGLALYSYKLNKTVRSATIKATILDCLFDAVITLLTLITLGISQITTLPVDAIIGLLVSGLIIYNGFISAKENVGLLLGNSLDTDIRRRIEEITSGFDQFNDIKSIVTNDFGPSDKIIVVELSPNQKYTVAAIQTAADDLSTEFERAFEFKTIVYWRLRE
ncbi:MAG: cation diffusion facilitator family transporter [Candidatus Nomurabacteria bacterium]|jgi:cation diffusion facilitator family transporter|nr:cation diffusion facilitator family transporter [Candidatus Nomurabacteria bacterium]